MPFMRTKKMQEIAERIAQDRAELLQAVDGLDEDQLAYRPEPGAWSVTDILHHLSLADDASGRLMTRMLQQARGEGFPPDPTPERSVLDALDQVAKAAENTKAVAPDRVAPRSHVPAAECIARLQSSRERLLSAMEELASFDLSSATFPHPFFGVLGAYQWLLLAGWHEQRHRKQIERIKSSPSFPRR
jgi:DinB superfamily